METWKARCYVKRSEHKILSPSKYNYGKPSWKRIYKNKASFSLTSEWWKYRLLFKKIFNVVILFLIINM